MFHPPQEKAKTHKNTNIHIHTHTQTHTLRSQAGNKSEHLPGPLTNKNKVARLFGERGLYITETLNY